MWKPSENFEISGGPRPIATFAIRHADVRPHITAEAFSLHAKEGKYER